MAFLLPSDKRDDDTRRLWSVLRWRRCKSIRTNAFPLTKVHRARFQEANEGSDLFRLSDSIRFSLLFDSLLFSLAPFQTIFDSYFAGAVNDLSKCRASCLVIGCFSRFQHQCHHAIRRACVETSPPVTIHCQDFLAAGDIARAFVSLLYENRSWDDPPVGAPPSRRSKFAESSSPLLTDFVTMIDEANESRRIHSSPFLAWQLRHSSIDLHSSSVFAQRFSSRKFRFSFSNRARSKSVLHRSVGRSRSGAGESNAKETSSPRNRLADWTF